jgi:DNA-binding GntR family transcriptional regulator
MEQLRRETLGDQLYRMIRNRILQGDLKRGIRLTQGELAQEMGVSRIPVRDALRRLEAEGLLASDELGRYTTVTFGADDAREIYAIRRRIETFALELAFDKIGKLELEKLRSIVRRMQELVSTDRSDEYVELDEEFHFTLYEACENPRLIKMIRALWVGVPRLVPIKVPLRMRNSLKQHTSILKLIEAGDKAGAVSALDNHIESAYAELLSDLTKAAA